MKAFSKRRVVAFASIALVLVAAIVLMLPGSPKPLLKATFSGPTNINGKTFVVVRLENTNDFAVTTGIVFVSGQPARPLNVWPLDEYQLDGNQLFRPRHGVGTNRTFTFALLKPVTASPWRVQIYAARFRKEPRFRDKVITTLARLRLDWLADRMHEKPQAITSQEFDP